MNFQTNYLGVPSEASFAFFSLPVLFEVHHLAEQALDALGERVYYDIMVSTPFNT